jgi:MFS transporter, PPP family, 3-phenylpropionic acid transporter
VVKIRLFTFNAFFFAGLATIVPFLVLYYQSLGFSGARLGLLVGITPLVFTVSAPFWTGVADATQRHRLVMTLSLATVAIALVIFPYVTTYAATLLVAVLLYMFAAPIPSLADSASLFQLADEKQMYGRIRLGGTLGFGLAAPVMGALAQAYGLRLTFFTAAGLLLMALLISQSFVYNPAKSTTSTGRSALTLLKEPHSFLFLVLAFSGGLAFSAANNYLFPYLKELGASETIMGWTLTIGVIVEIPILFFGHRLIQRFGSYRLLLLGLTITGVRLLLFALADSPNLVLLLQLLVGLTFPIVWVAGVAYADENAPPGMNATAQGLFGATIFGFGAAVSGFSGGVLLANLGGRTMFFLFGVTVLIILAITSLIKARLPVKQPAPV